MWALVFTSMTFMIPALKGFRNGMKLIPFINTSASIMSINYWRNPSVPSMRLQIDRVFAKAAFIVNSYHCVRYRTRALPWGGGAVILWKCATICFTRNKPIWLPMHMAFHLTSVRGMLINAGSNR